MFKIIIFLLILSITPVFAEISLSPNQSVSSSKIVVADSLGRTQYNQYSQGSGSSLRYSETIFMYVEFKFDSVYSGTTTHAHLLLNLNGYQTASFQRLGISSSGGIKGAEGHFTIGTDTEDMAYEYFESDEQITYGDGKYHKFACCWELVAASNLIRCTMYMDDVVEVYNITTTTQPPTHDLVKDNITAITLFQGVQSCNHAAAIREYLIIGSRNEEDIPHAKYYSILKAGSSGQMLFNTISTPISDQNIWNGNSPTYSNGGTDADCNYRRALFRSNTSWRHDFDIVDNDYKEMFGFTTPLQDRTNAYNPDYIRLYYDCDTAQYAHPTYYTNTQKRRR